MADKATEAPAPAPEAATAADQAAAQSQQRISWDDSNMTTTFANVVNGASTREEVTLFFGTNQTWNPGQGRDVKVQLSDRIILTPYAAKRLSVLLTAIVNAYEKAYGKLDIEMAERPGG